jgi:hypothetical protein
MRNIERTAFTATYPSEIKWWSPPGGKRNNSAKLSVETLKLLLSPKTKLVACGHVTVKSVESVESVLLL